MSVETWGEMPKSQIDNEKPEEMVARLIAVHEADPTAHAGDNESIDVHRKNTVIDHPASSIVPDKFSNNQPTMQNFFTSVTAYTYHGSVSQTGLGYVWLHTTNGSPAVSDIQIPLTFLDNKLYPDNDIIIDFVMRLVKGGSVYSCDITIGDSSCGFGFKIDQNGIKCFINVDDTQVISSYISYTTGTAHSFRIFVSNVDGAIYFYIDGVQVYSTALFGFGTQIFDSSLYVSTTSGNPASSSVQFSMLRAFYGV